MPDDHPLYAGVAGSFGWINANELAQSSDLWLAIGVSFSQMTTAAWNLEKPARVIQIDIDANELGKIFQPTLGIVADAREALCQLARAAAAVEFKSPYSSESVSEMTTAKEDWLSYQGELSQEGGKPINQYFLIAAMSRVLPSDSVVVGDSGMHAFMLFRAFHFLSSTQPMQGSRYQSLGSGLPIAIGAKLAMKDRTVVCFHGDGGLHYDIADLSFLAQHNIKVILIIDNNAYLAANRASAIIMKLQNPWVDLPPSTDFVAVARGFGIHGERVEDPEDVDAAIRRALDSKTSYVLDIITDPDTRIKRAIKDVVPIISDRAPQKGGEGHVSPQTRKSWPK
jgi:acetolactate synthase-1/2/3 large subunit